MKLFNALKENMRSGLALQHAGDYLCGSKKQAYLQASVSAAETERTLKKPENIHGHMPDNSRDAGLTLLNQGQS